MKASSVFLWLAAAAIGFTACSKDDENVPSSGSVINFNVTVPRAQRQTTTTASINQFYLWSFVGGREYMPGVSVSRSGSSWTSSPVMYWPGDGQPVDFYCISPLVGTNDSPLGGGADIKDYVNTDGTTDLLYAVTLGATKNPVNINFRHALSRLAFNFKRREASSTQAPLKVEVREVIVTDINTTASFTYPHATTSPNGDATGVWSGQSSPVDAVISQNQTVVLTDNLMNINSTGYEFVIPQRITESGDSYAGCYAKVLCSIYDENSGVRIWPSGQESDYLYFPLNAAGQTGPQSWDAGKAYAYNITIGVPAGTGKIEFDVTVDEYQQFDSMGIE